MPSRACTSLLQGKNYEKIYLYHVSMPSRACTSLLQEEEVTVVALFTLCQCPLGLVPHCYEEIKFSSKCVK